MVEKRNGLAKAAGLAIGCDRLVQPVMGQTQVGLSVERSWAERGGEKVKGMGMQVGFGLRSFLGLKNTFLILDLILGSNLF
jgi:hypothetical protein